MFSSLQKRNLRQTVFGLDDKTEGESTGPNESTGPSEQCASDSGESTGPSEQCGEEMNEEQLMQEHINVTISTHEQMEEESPTPRQIEDAPTAQVLKEVSNEVSSPETVIPRAGLLSGQNARLIDSFNDLDTDQKGGELS